MSDFLVGTVHSFNDRAGYGYITADADQAIDSSSHLLVHRLSLRNRSARPRPGERVRFKTETVPTGVLATDVHAIPQAPDDVIDTPTESVTNMGTTDLRSKALLARESKHYDEAARIYTQAIEQQPSVPLILSFAAMEKGRRRSKDAMQIYLRGIERFPESAKLWEDAGALALSMQDRHEAVRLFEHALTLSTKSGQGTKGVLLKLAQAHFEANTASSLLAALNYYKSASKLGRRPLSHDDLLQMGIAAVRTQHVRGNLSVPFLEHCGFQVSRADLNVNATESADLCVQETTHADLVESYGLTGNILVRCYFKTLITHADIIALDTTLIELSASDLIDEGVALIVVDSLSQDLQRILSARIEQKNRPQPAIVPITQAEMETSSNPLDALRLILDRWLFRRDLFATNSPVSGSKFFGRDKPLAELRDAISSSTCAGVYGLRKVGKTSLLQESRRRSAELGHLVIYIDLLKLPADVNDSRWLYWRIGNALKSEATALASEFEEIRTFKWRLCGLFPDYLDVPDTLKVATAFDSDISRFIETLQKLSVSPRPKIVLLLDEIERLLPTALGKADFTGFFDLLSYMRGLNQEKPEFMFIVTGANASISEIPQFDGRDNPVFNYIKEIYLPHQEPRECAQMIRTLGKGMGLTFSPESEQRIYDLTGGHPFFARQLCSYIAEANLERPFSVSTEFIEDVIDSYLDIKSSHFYEIVERLKRDYPNELAVCERLAISGGTLPRNEVRQMSGGETIKHLTGYQVVKFHGTSVSLSMELLTRWLQKRII